MKPWLRVAALAVLFLAVAAACSAGVHHSCTSVPPPIIGPPESGTPRAAFCGAVDQGWSRWSAALLLILLGAACGLAWPTKKKNVGVLAALIISVLVSCLIVSSLLESSITV